MTTGTRAAAGPLMPSHFAGEVRAAFAGRLGDASRPRAARQFARWWQRSRDTVGPASSLRTLVETCAAPMFALLGWRLTGLTVDQGRRRATARAEAPGPRLAVPVVLVAWGDDLDRCWRDAVRGGLALGSSWAFCWNARELRLVDAARPWGRRHVALDLSRCAADEDAFALLWGLARADALRPRGPSGTRAAVLDEVVAAAAAKTTAVCTGLERGVTGALVRLGTAIAQDPSAGREGLTAEALLDQCLTVVYRLLFLLFAEARALVPVWHRVYRDSYSIEALRDAVERDPRATGLWPAVQAVSRLAHSGCRVGDLRVTPFNGHLFAPDQAPLAERATVKDEVLRDVIRGLTTTPVRGGRARRIAFADLGVEQLGTIYERVLDHRLVLEPVAPAPGRRARPAQARLEASRAERKASATFYTPRALADVIVRRTLRPLVHGASAARIASLRVLDPAMGSGAFLVAACQYLAAAYESALVAEQGLRDHEIDDNDRAGFRRLVARQCLYGVDRNPVAVRLARLSLWLATLAADVPLTFLDHHLRVGNSLVGASLPDLLRQSPGAGAQRRAAARLETLPLFATQALDALHTAIPVRERLATVPDDGLAQVRLKERLLASLDAPGSPLAASRAAADAWCAAWFWRDQLPAPRGAVYGELLAAARGVATSLPARQVEALRGAVARVAGRERFFHWGFEFPEVFAAGTADDAAPGFDAVLGNPPWDIVRGGELIAFVRQSGIYTGTGDAHANLYLLFVERALQLLRPGGRLGLVVPWGLAADHGAGPVRRTLLDACRLDTCLALDNRRGLFPIHRSLRFVVVAGTRGARTDVVPVTRVGGSAEDLERCADAADPAEGCVAIPRGLLARVSGDGLAVPDLESTDELRLLDRLWREAPALSHPDGWHVRFGRELNATDDRAAFDGSGDGWPVIEGKHVEPFRAHADRARWRIAPVEAARRLPGRPFAHERVCYRDIASATNERTLIAAVVPAGVVTTHTLFCCRRALDDVAAATLCALLNSLVANWLARRWVSTHVTVALVERLPVPPPSMLGRLLPRLAELASALRRPIADGARVEIEAELQALAARAWRLTPRELELVLEDFPLWNERLVERVRWHSARAS